MPTKPSDVLKEAKELWQSGGRPDAFLLSVWVVGADAGMDVANRGIDFLNAVKEAATLAEQIDRAIAIAEAAEAQPLTAAQRQASE